MTKEEYMNKLKRIFKFSSTSRTLFENQINNYYNAQNGYKLTKHNYEVGDMVKLKKHHFMRGEGALSDLNDDKLKFISESGFISPDFLGDFNLKKKTPLTVPVWNIQKDILLKDYINLYSGATFLYTIKSENYKKYTCLVPYKKLEEKIEKLRNKDYWMWRCEETKEIRFLPSLARDNIQLGFIMNLDNEYGRSIAQNDIFNLSFDKVVLKHFISKTFIKDFIYANRDDFTTNRESAIIFGIPSCFIEGLLVGRNYEKNNKMLEKILKRASWSDIIVSIIFIVFGVMLVTNPGTIISMLSVILGGISVAIGAFKVIEYFSKGKEDSYLLGIGVAAILLGIVLMFCTGTILSIFRIVIGVWIIYTGIMNLNTAIQWKDLQSRLWLLTVIFSILVVIGGIYILANSGAILETIGVLIIIYGVMDIIERLIFMKKIDNYLK